jgi:enoyl-CoA hydratase
MAADVRYMSAGTIGLTEAAVGVPFPVSAIEICRHAMGASATAAALGAQSITAQEALQRGWIDAVVGSEDLLDVATARACALGALRASTYAFTKQQLHRPAHSAMLKGAADNRYVSETWCSEESRSRIAAFLAALGH